MVGVSITDDRFISPGYRAGVSLPSLSDCNCMWIATPVWDRYRAEGPGYIDVGLPYDMRKHAERIAQHLVDQQRIAADFHNPLGDDERLAVRNAYDDLRVTIEVGIEDTILNGTVVRFRKFLLSY